MPPSCSGSGAKVGPGGRQRRQERPAAAQAELRRSIHLETAQRAAQLPRHAPPAAAKRAASRARDGPRPRARKAEPAMPRAHLWDLGGAPLPPLLGGRHGAQHKGARKQLRAGARPARLPKRAQEALAPGPPQSATPGGRGRRHRTLALAAPLPTPHHSRNTETEPLPAAGAPALAVVCAVRGETRRSDAAAARVARPPRRRTGASRGFGTLGVARPRGPGTHPAEALDSRSRGTCWLDIAHHYIWCVEACSKHL